MGDLGTETDGALVVAVGRWREPALAELFRRHGGPVHSLARRVSGSVALADEVTQEVFLDLWRRPEQFDATRGSLRTLLLTKTHGKAVDLVRAETSRRSREQRAALERATADYGIDRQAWDVATAGQMRAAVDGLPADERTAIEMAYFGGHTYREVASLLSEPEGTVKSRIRSGLQRLRSALTRQGFEAPWAE